MSKITAEELRAGIVFGDPDNNEFVYMPGGEIGNDPKPFCIFENNDGLHDVPFDEALELIAKLHLKPAIHPTLGSKSY